MKLKDAIFEMKPGDKFKPNDRACPELTMQPNQTLSSMGDGYAVLNCDNLLREGEIIKPEKVLDAHELITQLRKEYATNYGYMLNHPYNQHLKRLIEITMENGRLERDLELRELAINSTVIRDKIGFNGSGGDFYEEWSKLDDSIKNLKPLKQ